MIGRIWTLALNTGREAIRNKLLYSLFFFAIGLMLLSASLALLSYVERVRILDAFGPGLVRLFSVAIAIFVGVHLIHKEVERRTVYTILSKPLSRAEFLLGKYLGLLLTMWMMLVLMAGFFALVTGLLGDPLGSGELAALFLTGVELAVVVAIATLFSAFTTPMLASLFSCALWSVGHLTRDLRDHGAASDSALIRESTAWMYQLLPDLESFNLSIEASHALPIFTSDVVLPALYGAGYVAVLLIGAIAIFERRDFR